MTHTFVNASEVKATSIAVGAGIGGTVAGPPGAVVGAVVGGAIAVGAGITAGVIIAEHNSNQRPSNWNKHTKPRPGRSTEKKKQKPDWKPHG